MSNQTKCCICNRELHSSTTRVIGNNDFCFKCGDAAASLVNEFTAELIKFIRAVKPDSKFMVIPYYSFELKRIER